MLRLGRHRYRTYTKWEPVVRKVFESRAVSRLIHGLKMTLTTTRGCPARA
jgi:hypothetical protein